MITSHFFCFVELVAHVKRGRPSSLRLLEKYAKKRDGLFFYLKIALANFGN